MAPVLVPGTILEKEKERNREGEGMTVSESV